MHDWDVVRLMQNRLVQHAGRGCQCCERCLEKSGERTLIHAIPKKGAAGVVRDMGCSVWGISQNAFALGDVGLIPDTVCGVVDRTGASWSKGSREGVAD